MDGCHRDAGKEREKAPCDSGDGNRTGGGGDGSGHLGRLGYENLLLGEARVLEEVNDDDGCSKEWDCGDDDDGIQNENGDLNCEIRR